jgi:hypothetical protein
MVLVSGISCSIHIWRGKGSERDDTSSAEGVVEANIERPLVNVDELDRREMLGSAPSKATQGSGKTTVAPILETKRVKARNANVGAVLLHPYVSSHFTSDFLVNRGGILLFGNFVGDQAAENERPGQITGLHTEIVPAFYP